MRRPHRLLLPIALVGLAALVGAPSARGDDDEPAPVAPAAPGGAVDRALEATNLRMKAALQRASILERLGRTDDALKALAEVETIHGEGRGLVDRLLGGRRTRDTGCGGTGQQTASDDEPGRRRIPRPAPLEPVTPWNLVHRVVDHLVAAQTPSGEFRRTHAPEIGRAPVADADATDLHATAVAVLALLDALDDAGEPGVAKQAAGRGVAALLSKADTQGRFGESRDDEGHALATWAVAAGCAAIADAPWRADARERLPNAVARLVHDRRFPARGPGAGPSPRSDWVAAAFAAAALHEVAALPRSFLEIEVTPLLARLSADAAEATSAEPIPARGADGLAHALLSDGASPDPEEGATPVADEVALLLATTLAAARGDDAHFDRYVAAVLVPSERDVQVSGRGAAFWDPVGERARRHGRTYATALRLLASLVSDTPRRTPAGG